MACAGDIRIERAVRRAELKMRPARTGSRLDPVLGDLGGKIAVYRCTQCEKTTTIAMDR